MAIFNSYMLVYQRVPIETKRRRLLRWASLRVGGASVVIQGLHFRAVLPGVANMWGIESAKHRDVEYLLSCSDILYKFSSSPYVYYIYVCRYIFWALQVRLRYIISVHKAWYFPLTNRKFLVHPLSIGISGTKLTMGVESRKAECSRRPHWVLIRTGGWERLAHGEKGYQRLTIGLWFTLIYPKVRTWESSTDEGLEFLSSSAVIFSSTCNYGWLFGQTQE